MLGEGGCGKSTFLYNDYLKWYNKINKKGEKRLFKSKNTMILYFRPNDLMDLTNENIDIIFKSSKEAKLKKVIFYIDGIDELGKYYDEIDSKNKLIEDLVAKFRNQYGENFILKAACRKNFAKNHDIENADAFSRIRHFKIEYWNTIQLEEISSNILNFFNEVLNSKDKYSNNDKKNQYIEKIRNIKKYLIDHKNHVFDDDNKPVDKCFINSPLLLILCLLTCIFSNQDFSEMLKNKNRYNLFESFIENSSNIYEKDRNNDLDNEIDILSKLAIGCFKNTIVDKRIQQNDLSKIRNLKFLIKENNDEITFIHARFIEHFIARKYFVSLMYEESLSNIYDVLGLEFNNDIVDQISFAMATIENNDNIADKLISFYNQLLNKEKIDDIKYLSKQFFMIKKEIIFRLGRLSLTKSKRSDVSEFLKNIYFTDKEAYNDGNNNQDYYIVMLKRWIAVSCSLLHTPVGEEIELDYINNMIKDDNNIYDLANRSETLVYYNDIKLVSSLEFRDNKEITKINPVNSIKKRLNRLSRTNDNDDLLIQQDDPKRNDSLRNYCFRAFDLSTIFCLLRKHKNYISELSIEDKNIIKNVKIKFRNANIKREELLEEVYKQLQKLIG